MTKKKKRARPGPKRALVPREANGRRSRVSPEVVKLGESPAQLMRARSSELRKSMDPHWGLPLGRLFIDGKISSVEYAAGKQWDMVAKTYLQAIMAPNPNPKSAKIAEFVGAGASADPDSDEGVKESLRHRKAVEGFDAARRALSDCGRSVETAVRRLCEGQGELPAGYESFLRAREGLQALVRFWRLTNAS